ncbi:hypothetical protein QL285_052382 [Trifolium repens]|nr:hypothetical protein QL285_052382 [Trifolium repens]
MVDLCGADPADIENEMVKTKRTYLLLLVGYTIFADTSKNCVYIHDVKNFDDLETVSEIAWGLAALVCLYNGLTACTAPFVSTLAGYMTLLQAWIHHHFPTLCERLEDERYDETMPAANRYIPRGGDQYVPARRVSLDRLLGCDIHWTPYDTHKATRPLDESIPLHPREFAPPFLTAPATALITVSLHFAGFMERVLTAAQRGPLVTDPWYAVSSYIRWYFRISHAYMTPMRGDPPRPSRRPLWRSRLSWLDPWRNVLRAN